VYRDGKSATRHYLVATVCNARETWIGSGRCCVSAWWCDL